MSGVMVSRNWIDVICVSVILGIAHVGVDMVIFDEKRDAVER